MNDRKKAVVIIGICIGMVAIFSAYILYRSFRPTKGLPYEELTMEQAQEYMEYEQDYCIVDVRSRESYGVGHIPGAVNIPLAELKTKASGELVDPAQMIYLYGGSRKDSKNAASLLCGMDYKNITAIGAFSDWKGPLESEG